MIILFDLKPRVVSRSKKYLYNFLSIFFSRRISKPVSNGSKEGAVSAPEYLPRYYRHKI